MRPCLVVMLLAASAKMAAPHDIITTKITFSREISRLVNKHCAFCHRDGGMAFSLMTYDQARPWAEAIKEETLERRMPPWNAVKGFGRFEDDRGLTQEDLEIISGWADGGAPEGDKNLLPPAPHPGDWFDSDTPQGSIQRIAENGTKLRAALNLVALRPKDLAPGTSVQAIAVRPDGTMEPLIWIYQFNPKFNRTYYYHDPVLLPAGTQIETSPANAGSFELFGSQGVGTGQ